MTLLTINVMLLLKQGTSKAERRAAFAEVKEEVKAAFTEEELEEFGDLVSKYYSKAEKEAVRELTLAKDYV